MSDEFEIIERWFTRPITDGTVRVGIGDDASIIDAPGSIAVAVDTLVAGTHFPEGFDARSIGHRALAVNLSDLAAVSAKPRWATLSLTLPSNDADWLDAFASGFFRLADRFGISLVGGDTTRGPLSITVGIAGNAAKATPLRSGGQVGDRIFVSGTLGDSSAALEHLEDTVETRSEAVSALLERFGFPEPRVDLGRGLDGCAHAAIDISDGLLADLGHICRQSGCGAELDLAGLPFSDALQRLHPTDSAEAFALHGGDDYELCFTVAPNDIGQVLDAAEATGTRVTEIGELTEGSRISGRRDGQTVTLDESGYTHF